MSEASVRLDFFVAHAAGVTRKQAKALIRAGRVALLDGTGQPRAGKANTAVAAADRVLLDGQPLALPGHRYLMIHKPAGVVCATRDGTLPTVMDLLPGAERENLRIVGRLDRDTTGLLLLTSDGDWSHRLTAPRQRCAKRYRVSTAEPLSDSQARQLADGVVLKDDPRPTRPAGVQRLDSGGLLLSLEEGRYHQVKRMLAAVGNRVVALHREAVGAIELDPALAPGEWRELSAAEVASVGADA
tara:strand:- start:3166 stop:3894 length:729 start_codon:yes stop_codon:yes gene_type:complete